MVAVATSSAPGMAHRWSRGTSPACGPICACRRTCVDCHFTACGTPCVSLLLSMGVHPRVVMEIVGHSGIEVTMNVYGHINLETQRRALNDLDQALS